MSNNIISAYSNTGNAPPIFGGTTRIAGYEVSSYIRSPYHKTTANFLRHYRLKTRVWVPPYGVVVAPPLVVQHTTEIGTGLLPTYIAANTRGNDTFVATPGMSAVISIYNTSSTPLTVSVIAQTTCSQGYLHNYTQLVPANSTVPTVIGPFDLHYYDGNNTITISYSASIIGAFIAILAP